MTARMLRLSVWCIGPAGVLALAAPGFAAEPGKAGMPQFDPTSFPPQVVWLAIAFVVLYLLMSKLALPRVAEVLQMRADRIQSDLDKAASLKA